MSDQVKKPSVFARIARWFREMRSEVKKIVWPTASQTANNTVIVIVSVLLVGVLIWIVDFLFHAGRDLLITLL